MDLENRAILFDLQAEQSVLGSILIDPFAIPKVSGFLEPADFYNHKHARIYRACLSLHDKQAPIDLITVGDTLQRQDFLDEVGGPAYLANLMNAVPTSVHIEHYARVVKNQARRRALVQVAGKIAAAVYEEPEAQDAEERAKSILLESVGQEQDSILITPERQGAILREYILSKKAGGHATISTGLRALDEQLGGGLRRGNLVVVAARTSVGKSTLAENIAEKVASTDHRVLFVSLEMSPEEIVHRYAVRSTVLNDSVPQFGISSDKDKEALEVLVQNRSKLPFYLLNAPAASTIAIRSAVSRINIQYGGLDLVVVDYLQLLKDAGHAEERLRIGQITANMKSMAREFNVPVVLLSQLNRNIEMRGGEPRLSDMLESGRIEADADVVVMLWNTDKPDVLGYDTHTKIAKNRQGATGKVDIIFDKPRFLFKDKG